MYDVACEWLLLKLHSNCSLPALISASRARTRRCLSPLWSFSTPLAARQRLIETSMMKEKRDYKRRYREERREREKKSRKE